MARYMAVSASRMSASASSDGSVPSLNDTPGPLWVGHCGLFTVDGAPKPAWDAFAEVAGGSA